MMMLGEYEVGAHRVKPSGRWLRRPVMLPISSVPAFA